MNKIIEKDCDQRQRFSLRKLPVGLASALVGASFMASNVGQTVHADELQTPSQPDHVIQKADNVATVKSADSGQSKTAIVDKKHDSNKSLPQTSSANDLSMLAAIGVIMGSLEIALAGIKKRKNK